MNAIIEAPSQLYPVAHAASKGKAAILQDQLVQVLAVQPIDEERAKQLIYDIASEEYSQLGNSEYETRQLRELFERAIPYDEIGCWHYKSKHFKGCNRRR